MLGPSRSVLLTSHLNEGTGSLSRSSSTGAVSKRTRAPQRRDREFIPVIMKPVTFSEPIASPQRRDREFIPVIAHLGGNRLVAQNTSTKGPGVYPGHAVVEHHDVFLGVPTSTKGPGVYPGHSCRRSQARTALAYLNEGTGSLSRSSPFSRTKLCTPTTSTKGPGVYPGHWCA